MKRLSAFMLALLMLLTLCACGKAKAPDSAPIGESSAETLVYSEPYVVSLSYAYPFDGGWRLTCSYAAVRGKQRYAALLLRI